MDLENFEAFLKLLETDQLEDYVHVAFKEWRARTPPPLETSADVFDPDLWSKSISKSWKENAVASALIKIGKKP
jgi:hypothetical protein